MKLKIALAQTKPYLGSVEKNLDIMYKNIDEAIENGADIIVFPELAVTGYSLKDMVPVVAVWKEQFYEKILEYSKKISIIFGGVEESKNHQFYNSAFYVEDGEIKHIHRKVYLPTYGMFDEYRYFAKGNKFRSFDTKFGRIGMLVCEDAWHMSSAYILAQDGADYIFVLSSSPSRGINDKEKLSSIKTWENINRVYADMFNLYLIYSNRVGYEDGINFWGGSEVIDPFGVEEGKAKYFEEELLFVEVEKQKIRRARIYSQTLKDEDISLTLRELNRIEKNKFENID
ncbi:nitrilase-related carbon-nitrogen hydrolase [Haliovirga abyssi]|uniref:Carbon-nitrogen hydrolase n=1 Tax=Haliovirga abyssi TaxID=2996794 RepID=A0AAU9DJW8_9FUSO|nr:nitrilase-related carbon-nitrogen hydrolase [Haliovirga abyssi]BDU51179.1 carbon-nitrogen hydrolase [Haliovirga abyssi]